MSMYDEKLIERLEKIGVNVPETQVLIEDTRRDITESEFAYKLVADPYGLKGTYYAQLFWNEVSRMQARRGRLYHTHFYVFFDAVLMAVNAYSRPGPEPDKWYSYSSGNIRDSQLAKMNDYFVRYFVLGCVHEMELIEDDGFCYFYECTKCGYKNSVAYK